MSPLQMTVLHILDNATKFEWSVQGMGMLRLYLRNVGRIHVWDSRLRYPGVSRIHTHSWDLRSTIVFGALYNRRFERSAILSNLIVPRKEHFLTQRIVCGYDTHTVTEPEQVRLKGQPVEFYDEGMVYTQRAHEIHTTDAQEGTVTLMERNQDGPMGEADVFWPYGTTWGDAKPRPATEDEVRMITASVIQKWALPLLVK